MCAILLALVVKSSQGYFRYNNIWLVVAAITDAYSAAFLIHQRQATMIQ